MKTIHLCLIGALAVFLGQLAQGKEKENPEGAKITQEAREAAANKDWDKAIELYRKAMNYDHKLSTNLSIAYQQRGFASASEQRFQDAISDFGEAIKLTPQDSRVWEQRATMEIKVSDSDKALADFSQAIKLNPNEARVYLYRAYIYEMKNDNKSALADTDKALKIDSKNAQALERKTRLQRKIQAQQATALPTVPNQPLNPPPPPPPPKP